jgi:hypothetical protein
LINYAIAPQGNTVLIAVGVFFAVVANISGALSTHYKHMKSNGDGHFSSFDHVEFVNLQVRIPIGFVNKFHLCVAHD